LFTPVTPVVVLKYLALVIAFTLPVISEHAGIKSNFLRVTANVVALFHTPSDLRNTKQ